MARIFYSMSGEGRGHAVRARAVVCELSKHHDITLFAPNDAYDFLEPIYRGTKVRIHRMPGPRFYYNKDHHLDTPKTVYKAFVYLLNLPKLLGKLSSAIRKGKPDLVITDFEPALQRAGKRCGVPVLLFDHQQFLIVNDLSDLPFYLRFQAGLMGIVVRLYRVRAGRKIVTSFFNPPLKKAYQTKDIVQVSSILRPIVTEQERTSEGHLVAYIRKYAPDNLMTTLKAADREVRIFGLGERERDENLVYKEINESEFLKDLSSSDGLICTAGNQLLGEAFFLQKPVLALPESKNYEQYINAFYVEKNNAGIWREMHVVQPEDMKLWLEKLPEFSANIDPEKFNGTPKAVAAIEEYLAITSKERPQ